MWQLITVSSNLLLWNVKVPILETKIDERSFSPYNIHTEEMYEDIDDSTWNKRGRYAVCNVRAVFTNSPPVTMCKDRKCMAD